jgi:uncharacterized membrane protein YwaF
MDITSDQITQIFYFVIALLAVWLVLRLVLKITRRIFQFGCLAIVLLGVFLILIQAFSGT